MNAEKLILELEGNEEARLVIKSRPYRGLPIIKDIYEIDFVYDPETGKKYFVLVEGPNVPDAEYNAIRSNS